MEDGSMFNAVYLDPRRLTRTKAEVMNTKTNTDAIILDSVFNFD
jgi:hypothetical protein